ncbi:F-box only protein 9 [Armadillidium nasatum]|uniref:F-box only protein 9 n=3 Tax=Armadillidium nasatum TaxID=96803 RepID=A0A5N5T4S4_9CRUS|nr:F-box only protein 9 [Armadillidium nasatum]
MTDMNSEELLSSFRQEWRRELHTNTSTRKDTSELSRQNSSFCSHKASHSSEVQDGIHSDLEIEAANLFRKGVQLEQNGQLYEAIRFYRKAIALVPDIETRVHNKYVQERLEDNFCDEETEDEGSLLEDPECKDLITRFENLLVGNDAVCQPQTSQQGFHLSYLPNEMVEKIISWVIGSELDLESLEKLASVCRGLFLMCRKPELWRKACLRVWGINTGDLNVYPTWRDMFIYRARPRFNGCYISKTTYFRSGENSFQDLSYQPWHIVCYYRYLRFFSQGHVLMLTSSEEPQNVVANLKNLSTKNPQVLVGHFRIHGASLTMLFRKINMNLNNNKHRKRRRGQGTTDVAETTFQIEMEVKAIRGRPHWQLVWRGYSVASSYQNGSHATSIVNVSDQNNFPSLNFSKVKSYSAESTSPLF